MTEGSQGRFLEPPVNVPGRWQWRRETWVPVVARTRPQPQRTPRSSALTPLPALSIAATTSVAERAPCTSPGTCLPLPSR